MRTFNELIGLSPLKPQLCLSCFGGGSSSSSSNDSSNDSSSSSSGGGFFGYDSLADMFDGGGPGASGDSFSNVDNTALDTDGDGHISSSEAVTGTGSANLAGGIDGTGSNSIFNTGGSSSSDAETALIDSDLSDDEFWAEFEAGTSGMNTSTGTVTSGSSGSNETAASFYDANTSTDNVLTNDNVITSTSSGGGSSTSSNTNTSTSTSTSGGSDTSTSGGSDTSTSTTTTSTDTTNNDLIDDLNNQIKNLQDQLNNMSGGGTTVVYEGSGGTETALPDDYLTEADLARYFDNLDLGSSAYDPAAFLNAYGFALDPAAYGGIIPTFSNTNGVYMRRAVKDKDTGEIRYVNVPIGAGAMNGNDGLSMFRNERRTGFGSFL